MPDKLLDVSHHVEAPMAIVILLLSVALALYLLAAIWWPEKF